MASQPKIEVAISAKADQLSASLAKVRKEIAGLPAIAKQANGKMGALDPFGSGKGRAVFGLDRIEKQIGRLYGSARVGAGGLSGGIGLASRTIPGLGLVAGAASVAGIGEMMNSLAGAGVELTNTSRLAGTTAAGLNSMRGAARLMGLSAGTADQAMLGLNHTIQDAVYGKNAEALNYFKLAGVDIGSIATGAKSADAILPKLVDTLTKAAKTNPLAAERLAQIWGIPSAALPMLIRGSEALQANRREVERMYGSFDRYQESSERFTFATGRLSLASEKLGQTVMTSLEPHLTPLLLSLSSWVEKHDKDIGEVFDHMGHAIAQIDWKQIGEGVDEAGQYAKTAAKWFDDLASSWKQLNDFGKPVSDFLNRITGAGPGAQDAATIRRAGPNSAEWASPRERAGASAAPVGGVRTFDTTLSPEARGLLDTIAGTESPGYNVLYGGGRFSDMSHHPNVPVPITSGPNAGKTSTGAGRYQFLNGTWEEARAALNLPDFSPGSQDKAGWWLAQRDYFRRTGRDLATDIKSTDPNIRRGIGQALHGTWTSLPGGIEAGTNDDRFSSSLSANTAQEQRRAARSLNLPSLSPAMPQQTQPVVRVDINHTNAPAGTTVTPSVSGQGAELGGIRIRRAMPEAGGAAFGGT